MSRPVGGARRSRVRTEAEAETRNVLVLAYDFPPCRAPGAAVRTAKFVRYLPEFGWRATVVCRGSAPGSDQHVISIPSGVPETVSYQAAAWVWALRIESRVRALLAARPFDVVYATGPPFAHLLVAARVAREAAVPLVVDFRDGWSFDPSVAEAWGKRVLKRGLVRWVYPRLERKVLSASEAAVTNAPSLTTALESRAASAGTALTMVSNGFDEADFAGPAPIVQRGSEPEFLYCGRFEGIAGRSPAALLRAVRAVVDSGRRLTLRVLGDDGAQLRRRVRALGLDSVVRLEGAVEHAEAVRAIRRADVLVLYQAAGTGIVTPVAGKTFEYLRSGRPLLAVVPPGDNSTLVSRYAEHYRLVPESDPESIARAMSELVDMHPGETCEPGPEFARYDRRVLAGRLAGVFDEVARSSVG